MRMLGPDERLGTAGEGPLLRAAPCQTGLVLEGSSQFWQGQIRNVPVSSRGFQSVPGVFSLGMLQSVLEHSDGSGGFRSVQECSS